MAGSFRKYMYTDSRIWYPSLCILNFLIMVAQYIISGFSSTAPNGVIKNDMSDQSEKYHTQITPAGWTFSIWSVIYVWQGLWIIYSMVNICRRSTYNKPMFLPSTLFIFNILALGCCIAWLFIFDNDEVIAAFLLLFAYSLFLYGALATSYAGLDMASPAMVDDGRTPDIWVTRVLVHNSIGLQAGWVTVATLLNAAIVMAHKGDPIVDQTTSGTVALCLLTGVVLIFTITDLLALDRYSRYTLTPYIAIIVALAGSIDKNWDAEARNSIFSAVLLSVVCLLFALKLVLTVYMHFTRRHYTAHYEYDITDDKGFKISTGRRHEKNPYKKDTLKRTMT